MAFSPSPKVAAARDYGKKFDRESVIILSFSGKFSLYEVVSWGKTRELCGAANLIAQELENAFKEAILEHRCQKKGPKCR
jgi:hypothetical protein